MNAFSQQSKLTASHSMVFLIVAIFTLATAMLIGTGTPTIHLMLLVFLLPVSGIPHGALDYHLGSKTLEHRLGRRWLVWFLAIYLIGMLGVIAVWIAQPVLSLYAFLLLTLFHFGTGDAIPMRQTPSMFRITETIARGGMVITFPALAARPEVIELFSFLIPESDAVILVSRLAQIAPLVSACVLLTIGWGLFELARFREPVALGRVVELTVIALIFIQLPPLLAFTIYFSLLHSLRHMMAVADWKPGRTFFIYLFDVYRLALPLTIVTVVMGAVAYLLLSGLAFDMTQLMRVVFIGIAAMTYPHVLLIEIAKRKGIIPGRTRREGLDLAIRFVFAHKSSQE